MHEQRGTSTAIAVSLVTGCSSAFMDVSTKGWTACLRSAGGPLDVVAHGGWVFWASVVGNVFFMFFLRFGLIWGCQHCDVLLFVPLNAVLNTFISVAAGIVALCEGSDVISWAGLVFSGISCATGTILLAGGPQDVHDATSDLWDSEGGPEDSEGEDEGGEASPLGFDGDVGEATPTPHHIRMCSANFTAAVANLNIELKDRWRRKSRVRRLVERIRDGDDGLPTRIQSASAVRRRRTATSSDSDDGSSDSDESEPAGLRTC